LREREEGVKPVNETIVLVAWSSVILFGFGVMLASLWREVLGMKRIKRYDFSGMHNAYTDYFIYERYGEYYICIYGEKLDDCGNYLLLFTGSLALCIEYCEALEKQLIGILNCSFAVSSCECEECIVCAPEHYGLKICA